MPMLPRDGPAATRRRLDYRPPAFLIDRVALEFESGALEAIADQAMARHTGARALRTIIEEIMLNVMFEIPSLKYVKKCRITEGTVREHSDPLLLTANGERYSLVDQSEEPAA